MEVGFEKGKITLEHENGVYYAGQVMNGNIQFRLKEHVNITAINIQFLGEARVLWSEEEKEVRSGQSFKTKVDYKGQEQYFNTVQCVMGGQGILQLKPGPQSIPFKFQVPWLIPSSFKGDKGEVVYEIKAYMEFPEQQKPRKELARLFEVIAPLDLNKADPKIAQPLQISFEEVYNCGCACRPRPVTVEVSLAAGGYCPGQVVPVTINVHNRSNIEVKRISLQIVSKNRYHAQQPAANYSTPEQKLSSAKTGAVLSNTERHFTCDLPLPDMIAPNLTNCRIIDVEYYFKVAIKLSGCNDDLTDATQFYIGLKPLDSTTDGTYVHPLADRLPPGPIPEFKLDASQPQPIAPTSAASTAYPGPLPFHRTAPYPPTAPYPVPNPPGPFNIGFKMH